MGKVARICAAKKVHPLDLIFVDGGHAWKTNPPDLNRTMRDAGFSDVKIYQRALHLSRFVAGSRQSLEFKKKIDIALNAVFFQIPRGLLKLLIPQDAGVNQLRRYSAALERRIWFGSNRVKHKYSEEVLVVAIKSS